LSSAADRLEEAAARLESRFVAEAPSPSAPAPERSLHDLKADAVRLARDARDFPRALAAWREYLRRGPPPSDVAEAWAAVGRLSARVGDAPAAEDALRRAADAALPASPMRRKCSLELAALLARRKAYADAALLAEGVATEEGVDAETWAAAQCALASCAASLGETVRARAAWQSVVDAARTDGRLAHAAAKASRAIEWLGRPR
jgi:hypothetical protein